MAQSNTPTALVSRSAPQAHPIFLLKPIQYPTPNHPRFNQPATVIRPILSSNLNLPVTRPPLVRRLLRPTIIRPFPPRLVTNENSFIPPPHRFDPVVVQTKPFDRESSIESSLSTLSTISSHHDELIKKKTCCHCLPCCRPKGQQPVRQTPRTNNSHPNLKLNNRTIYIIIGLLFIFFLIVIILLIVLIAVRR